MRSGEEGVQSYESTTTERDRITQEGATPNMGEGVTREEFNNSLGLIMQRLEELQRRLEGDAGETQVSHPRHTSGMETERGRSVERSSDLERIRTGGDVRAYRSLSREARRDGSNSPPALDRQN
jgi:hypothetical protein